MAFKKRRREGQFITPERLLKDNQNRLSDRKRFKRQEKRINYSFIPVDKSDGLLLVFRLNVSSATLIQELLTKHAFTMVRPSVAGDR